MYRDSERVTLVLNGQSKRRKGFTQAEVCELFEHGYNAQSGTGSFESDNGILEHYRTIEAIKTLENVIISNNECFSRGFAHCTKPNYTVSMDLSTIYSAIASHRQDLREIKILATDGDATLFTWRKRFFLNGMDEGRYLVELVKPCKTINEALESMKPQAVKIAEKLNEKDTIKRQGEWFLIPLPTVTDKDVKDIERIEEHKELVYDYNEEKYFVAFEKIFPEIEDSRHKVTRKGKFLNDVVVKGTVRHPEHAMLKLGKAWYRAIKNQVKNSWSIGRGRD